MTHPLLPARTADFRTSYGFEPSFFDRTQADEARCHGAPRHGPTDPAPTNAPDRPSGYDVPMLANVFRQLNEEFLKSAAGERARREWTAAFEVILDFARVNGLGRAEAELLKLRSFRQAHQGAAVGGEIELYRPDYKPQLEALARHLHDSRIRLEDRCDALERLDGLDLCAARHRSEIRREVLRLQGMGGGLGEAVWSAFSELTLGHLAELLRAEPQLAHLDFSTPHALNPFAAAMRLPGHSLGSEQNDAYVVDVRLHADIVKRCSDAMEQRLGMTVIAQHLADEALLAVRTTLDREIDGALDLNHGPGHWAKLEKTVQTLAARFGALHARDFIELGEDDLPRGLTDDTRLLTIRIRHAMAQQKIAPAPMEQWLERRGVGDGHQRFMLFEGRWPYVVVDAAGKRETPMLRLPTLAEVDDLLRPPSGSQGPSAHRCDETTRRVLTTFADALRTAGPDPAAAVRQQVAADPTAEGLQTVIERQGLDDQALAAWLDEAAPRWSAAALDEALQLLIGGRRAAPLAALLAAWRAEGFADSWQRCVRGQAARDRALNTDARIQGPHADGDLPGQDRAPPQQQMLARVERQLGAITPLAAARARLQAFRACHPAGGDRQAAVAGSALREALDALRDLRAGPARLLTVPLLAEDGGLSEALESTFYAGSPARLQHELDLIFNVATGLDLSPEETASLLQVTSRDRIPVPSPFASAALLSGRFFVVDCLFDWASDMFRQGWLDTSAAKRLLLPDALEAGQAVAYVKDGPVFQALQRYLTRLDTARDLGMLKSSDLAAAASYAGTPALLHLAAERGGKKAAARLEAWRSQFG